MAARSCRRPAEGQPPDIGQGGGGQINLLLDPGRRRGCPGRRPHSGCGEIGAFHLRRHRLLVEPTGQAGQLRLVRTCATATNGTPAAPAATSEWKRSPTTSAASA